MEDDGEIDVVLISSITSKKVFIVVGHDAVVDLIDSSRDKVLEEATVSVCTSAITTASRLNLRDGGGGDFKGIFS